MADNNSWQKKIEALIEGRDLRSESEVTKLHKFVHFWVLLGKSFIRNRCPIRASALSYTTLLAMIPMLAVAASIANSLLKSEGEDQIFQYVEKFVSTIVPPAQIIQTNTPAISTNAIPSAETQTNSPPAIASVETTNSSPAAPTNDRVTAAQRAAAKKIHEFIQNTQSGTLGVTGLILLVIAGIRLLGSIESTFNDIWGVTRGRNWLSRVQIYCTAMVLGPLLLGGAAALSSGPHLQATRDFITHFPIVGPIVFPALTVILLWITFALFYQLVPNTKVNPLAALVGGIVSGTFWHLLNVFGFLFAARVVTYSKIYGSLALVPVFMIGVYTSWFIMLFGAQLAYAFQNRTLYLQEKIAENVNQRGREFVALRLMTCIGQRFQRGLPAATIQEMSLELGIPSRLVQTVLRTLIAAHLVTELSGAEPAYTPARPLDGITAHHILQAMRVTIGQELVTRDEPVRQEIYGEFARIQEAEKQAASSVTMLALVGRAQSRLELIEPKVEESELKLKPALAPKVEPKPEQSKAVAPEIFEPAPAPAVEIPETKPEPKIEVEKTGPQNKIQHVQPVATPEDEERDFPL
jgi:membrane protein